MYTGRSVGFSRHVNTSGGLKPTLPLRPTVMPLKEYRSKRHFDKTAEPAGSQRPKRRSHWRFVVQKHAATRLHYDFRLEYDGVLKSWAVPHGPCLDPTQRRLAVQVEDHPIEYGDFEGTIPAGEYGGGTVLLWDSGHWACDDDVAHALEIGKLKFRLEGHKLTGAWTLVRMRRKPGETRDNWLLIKERDGEARPLSEYDVLVERPESVTSGQTLNEITANSDRTWNSRPAKRGSPALAVKRSRSAGGNLSFEPIPKSRKAPFPKSIEPQLATPVEKPPTGGDWLHEIKLDGYRILASIDGEDVYLRTRKQNDWTRRFPEIAESLRGLPVRQAVLDGEVVALGPEGQSDFQALQGALSEVKTGRLVYYVFDLLYLDGRDLRPAPLAQRKQSLAELLAAHPDSRIHYSDHMVGNGPEVFEHICQLKLEGIVSKRAASVYAPGRSDAWLKIKSANRDEFVIGGFTEMTGSRKEIGALLVGYFDPAGKLIYCGKVGSGFTARTEQDLRERLKVRELAKKPFATTVLDEHRAFTHWVRPELVAEVRYSNWTEGGNLRHGVFLGLREDKPASEVVLDREAPPDSKSEKRRESVDRAPRRPRKVGADASSSRQALKSAELRELEGLKLTNPQRIVFPEIGLTKRDLLSYYVEVSEWILPHVVNRPLSLVRCPEGISGHCFYQKRVSPGMPDALKRIAIQEGSQEEECLYITSLAGLLSIVQMGGVEIHPWGATIRDLDKPDRLVFDLDPDPSVPWSDVVVAAKQVRDLLLEWGLKSFPKTSGGKGLHLVVPLQRRAGWAEAKTFCRAVAKQLAAANPQRYTANMSKAQRPGKIFVDYLRNDRGSTAIAPYSTRCRPGAPVAMPVSWKEVTSSLRPDLFHVRNAAERLQSLPSDPWSEMTSVRQSLNKDVLRRAKIQ